MMNRKITDLAELIRNYISDEILWSFAEPYKITFENFSGENDRSFEIAHFLFSNIHLGANDLLLKDIIYHCSVRAAGLAGTTTYEHQQHHQSMSNLAVLLMQELDGLVIPDEIHVADLKPFSAKSEIRDLIAVAKTDVFLVDPYVGTETLDCMIDCNHPIRILSNRDNTKSEFVRALTDFKKEKPQIEIRYDKTLHDRFLIFNQKCFLLGSSMKDAGKKMFNCIQIHDNYDTIVASLESKWEAGKI